MNHNLIFILILLFAIIIVIIFYKFKLWSQKSHTTAISIITASGVFFTLYVIYVQIIYHSEEIKNNNNIFFQNLLKNLFDDTINFFIDHPEMDYFYNEIYYNIKVSKNNKRNKILEKQICMKIFYNTAIFIFYYNTHKKMDSYVSLLKIQQGLINKMYTNFLNSSIFKENIVFYIKNYAGTAFVVYMKDNFNINEIKIKDEDIKNVKDISK